MFELNLKQTAASIVIALGADRAAKIYKHLKDDEIEAITLEVANLGSSKEEIDKTLADFISHVFRTN